MPHRFGGDSVRVFERFSEQKLVTSKQVELISPGCRLAKPCRDEPFDVLFTSSLMYDALTSDGLHPRNLR